MHTQDIAKHLLLQKLRLRILLKGDRLRVFGLLTKNQIKKCRVKILIISGRMTVTKNVESKRSPVNHTSRVVYRAKTKTILLRCSKQR